jgi:hypothetical protein
MMQVTLLASLCRVFLLGRTSAIRCLPRSADQISADMVINSGKG